jgi:hypothetical protein
MVYGFFLQKKDLAYPLIKVASLAWLNFQILAWPDRPQYIGPGQAAGLYFAWNLVDRADGSGQAGKKWPVGISVADIL